MKYVRVDCVLPEKLVKEIQKYVQGEYIYIPSLPENRKKWGEKSKIRDYLRSRNEKIVYQFLNGHSISDLAREFYLSESSIKKIVYKKSK
ncbi:CD3324 family protein [Fusibacter bizertensis]